MASGESGGFVAQNAEDVLALTVEDLKKMVDEEREIEAQTSSGSPLSREFVDLSRIPEERFQECLNHLRYHHFQSRIRLFQRENVLI
jgi:hypothetical protein